MNWKYLTITVFYTQELNEQEKKNLSKREGTVTTSGVILGAGKARQHGHITPFF